MKKFKKWPGKIFHNTIIGSFVTVFKSAKLLGERRG